MNTEAMKSTRAFFEGFNQRGDMQTVLAALDQTVRFLVEDGEPFQIKVSGGVLTFVEGTGKPELKDHVDFTHFQTDCETIRRLVAGEIRYTDAVIPSAPDMGCLILVEKWMYKKAIINWLGRLIRMGQEGPQWLASRPTEGWVGEP